jgi:hypothetical protein
LLVDQGNLDEQPLLALIESINQAIREVTYKRFVEVKGQVTARSRPAQTMNESYEELAGRAVIGREAAARDQLMVLVQQYEATSRFEDVEDIQSVGECLSVAYRRQ